MFFITVPNILRELHSQRFMVRPDFMGGATNSSVYQDLSLLFW
jgi:hypothetical protein